MAAQELAHRVWCGPELGTSSESGSSLGLPRHDRLHPMLQGGPQLAGSSESGSSRGLDAGVHVVYNSSSGGDSREPDPSAGGLQGPHYAHEFIVKRSFIEVVDAGSTALVQGARMRSRSASVLSSGSGSRASRGSPREAGSGAPAWAPAVPLVPPPPAAPSRPPKPTQPTAAAPELAPEAADAAEAVEREPQAGWSKGSQKHNTDCRPCLYVHSLQGCLSGEHCQFCHFTHAPRARTRLCKAKRQQCVKRALKLFAAYNGDVARLLEEHPALGIEGPEQSEENIYTLSIIKSKQRQQREGAETASAAFLIPEHKPFGAQCFQ